MGCETMKKSLELEKQRYRGLLEQRVVDTGEAKLAADSARAANAILQKAIKEYDVWTPIFSLIVAHAKRLLAIRAFVCVNMEPRFRKVIFGHVHPTVPVSLLCFPPAACEA